MPRVLISYRREDSAGHAGRLLDHLRWQVPGIEWTMDVSNIDPGVDFRQWLDRAVRTSDVVLAIIGRRWLEMAKADGTPRLADPNDTLRREIAGALAAGVAVIPVLVNDARMPEPGALPEDLCRLSGINAVSLHDSSFEAEALALGRVLRARFGVAPIQVTGTLISNDWHLVFILNDLLAISLSYRFDDEPAFKPLPTLRMVNFRTGRPSLNPTVFVANWGVTGRHTIDVKFVEIDGEEQGPFRLEFDCLAQYLGFVKETLSHGGALLGSVVDLNGERKANLSGLTTYRAAFRAVEYRLDDGEPHGLEAFPQVPDERLAEWCSDSSYLEFPLPPAARRFALRLTYRDGTSTDWLELDVPPPAP